MHMIRRATFNNAKLDLCNISGDEKWALQETISDDFKNCHKLFNAH